MGLLLAIGISDGGGREVLVSEETVDAATARAVAATPLWTRH